MTENKMHCMSSHQTVLGIKVSQLDLTQAGEWLAEHSAAGFICCPALIYRRPCHPQVNIAAPWHLTNLPTVLPWHMQKALGRRAGREKAWAWFLAYSTSVGSKRLRAALLPLGWGRAQHHLLGAPGQGLWRQHLCRSGVCCEPLFLWQPPDVGVFLSHLNGPTASYFSHSGVTFP